MEMIEWVLVAIILLVIAPVFAFAVSRAAATGWYGVKHYYQRRLVDDLRRGETKRG